MLCDRRRARLRRIQYLQGQSIQRWQEPEYVNWRLILAAVGGIALVAAAARRQSSTSERVTFERNPAPVAGISESATIPWGRYAVAGLAGYLGGKLIETSLSIPVMSQGPPSPSTLEAPPRGPVQNPNRAGGQIDWSSVLFGPALKAIDTTGASVTPPIPIWTPPSDYQWLSLIRHPAVVLTIGSRGAGKSALNYRLLELLRGHGEPYVVVLPEHAHKYLPAWLGNQDRLEDVPRGAVVLLDESYLQLHSRSSMNQAGRSIGNLINLSRQNRQTLLFVVPDARQIDVNVVSQIDVLAIKELSELSKGYERPQLQRLTDKARAAFATLQGGKRRWTGVHADAADFEGLVKNELPSFWSTRLSHAYDHETSPSNSSPRRGKRLAREEMKAQAKKMHASGFSYAQIAHGIVISKTMAWNLVIEP